MLTINENHKKLIAEREIILHLFLEYIQIIPNKILLLFVKYSTKSVTVGLEQNKQKYLCNNITCESGYPTYHINLPNAMERPPSGWILQFKSNT